MDLILELFRILIKFCYYGKSNVLVVKSDQMLNNISLFLISCYFCVKSAFHRPELQGLNIQKLYIVISLKCSLQYFWLKSFPLDFKILGKYFIVAAIHRKSSQIIENATYMLFLILSPLKFNQVKLQPVYYDISEICPEYICG